MNLLIRTWLQDEGYSNSIFEPTYLSYLAGRTRGRIFALANQLLRVSIDFGAGSLLLLGQVLCHSRPNFAVKIYANRKLGKQNRFTILSYLAGRTRGRIFALANQLLRVSIDFGAGSLPLLGQVLCHSRPNFAVKTCVNRKLGKQNRFTILI
jgi:hypothetical protein